jgi:hypothetical protein
MRSIARVCDVSPNTVDKVLVDAGRPAPSTTTSTSAAMKAPRIQCDEIWSFCYSKQKNVRAAKAPADAGDVWTWTAIEAQSKLVISYLSGGGG